MERSTIDRLISTIGILLIIMLILGSIVLFISSGFIHSQVTKQLQPEKVSFPAANSTAYTSLPASDQKAIAPYVGQAVLTGAQAEVFADNYIAVHLNKIGGGKTYSELSTQSMSDPTNTALTQTVNTVFKGETLRGLLLNAYAFDTMATVAQLAGYGALGVSILLFFLSLLGFYHASLSQKKHVKR
jgi:hypothetical protein